jgi:hypothetical protein
VTLTTFEPHSIDIRKIDKVLNAHVFSPFVKLLDEFVAEVR